MQGGRIYLSDIFEDSDREAKDGGAQGQVEGRENKGSP